MQLRNDTVPVLVGPVSYLLLSKPAMGVHRSFSLLSLLGSIFPSTSKHLHRAANILIFTKYMKATCGPH